MRLRNAPKWVTLLLVILPLWLVVSGAVRGLVFPSSGEKAGARRSSNGSSNPSPYR